MVMNGQLYPEEGAPCTCWIRDWVGAKTGLGAVKKNLSASQNRIPISWSYAWPVLHYADSRLGVGVV